MRKCGRGGTLLAIVSLVVACTTSEVGGPIEVEVIGRIKGDPDDGGFASYVVVSPMLPDGRRVAFEPHSPSPVPVVVIGRDGYVVDTLAMPGEGPGQINRPRQLLLGRGDTLFIFGNSKAYVYSPGLEYVRSFSVSVRSVWSAAQLGSGDLALSTATFGDPELVVVASSLDGKTQWTVNAPVVAVSERAAPLLRMVAAGPDSSLWVARLMGSLEFLHYSPAGVLLDSVKLDREWYPNYVRSEPPSRERPPSASLSGFWVDSLGRLWLVGRPADPEWKDAEGEERSGEGGYTYFEPKHLMDVYDGVIEAVDPASGRSLALLRTDSLFGLVQAPGVLVQPRVDGDGWSQLELSRIVPRF